MRREGYLSGHRKGGQGERWPRVALSLTHLYEDGLEAIVVAVERGAAVWLAGQVDARGTVQLLQLVVTTLLLDHPVGRAEAVPGLLGEASEQRLKERGDVSWSNLPPPSSHGERDTQ